MTYDEGARDFFTNSGGGRSWASHGEDISYWPILRESTSLSEMNIGEGYFLTKDGYSFLKPEMLAYAQTELSKKTDDQYSLDLRVYDYETELIELLIQKGYKKTYSEPIRIFQYESGFLDRKLPEGFTLMTLEEENDPRLEPLATDPLYRRLGLATVILTEQMKRTQQLGATYCFGGAPDFYPSIGFETVCHRDQWSKKWSCSS